jgi:RNA polymerase sigma-70 factor (ECF subfamily)
MPLEAEAPTAPNGWPVALLRGFRAGDREALADVYRRHADDVAAFLQRGFTFEAQARWYRFAGYGSAFDLQDALHQTFRLAFEPAARNGYDGVRPYGPYLLTIARNVALRAFRLREKLFAPLRGDEDGPPPFAAADAGEPGSSPEQQLLREQARAMVRAFLDGLSAQDRDLLQLRFVEGLSQRDAAERLGIGRQSVRSRETRLREQLVAYVRAREEPRAGLGGALVSMVGLGLARGLSDGWMR